jgi:hypothetical protein
MKFSDDMRFPHPVLAFDTGDFSEGEFSVSFEVSELLETGQVSLRYAVELSHPDLVELVMNGNARVGIFVRCRDTYFSELRELGWPSGNIEFGGGKLLNRVAVRPLVWLTEPVTGWTPAHVHAEFDLPLTLARGDIAAIGDETAIHVGRAKLAPLESIFSLQRSEQAERGELKLNLNAEKITIVAHPETFDAIELMRSKSIGRAAILSSVYLPIVMEVLDRIRAVGSNTYDGWRWFSPFEGRCIAKGVNLENPELLPDAQLLLDLPAASFKKIAEVLG